MINFLNKLDISAFKFFNIGLHISALDQLFIFIGNIDFSLLAVAVALLLMVFKKRYHIISGILILAAAELSWSLGSILKRFFDRPRPFEVLSQINFLAACEKGLSFPSGHALAAFALATVVALRYPKLKYPAFALAILVAYSRIFVGVHYPSDVIFGALLGFMISYYLVKIAREIS